MPEILTLESGQWYKQVDCPYGILRKGKGSATWCPRMLNKICYDFCARASLCKSLARTEGVFT